MAERQKIPISDRDLRIDPGLAAAYKANQAGRPDLYDQVFEMDDEVALYIRDRAAEQFPDDLNAREIAAQLALEVAHMDRAQLVIDGLSSRLFGRDREALEPHEAQADLPPAA
jgi:hypothetical protein